MRSRKFLDVNGVMLPNWLRRVGCMSLNVLVVGTSLNFSSEATAWVDSMCIGMWGASLQKSSAYDTEGARAAPHAAECKAFVARNRFPPITAKCVLVHVETYPGGVSLC